MELMKISGGGGGVVSTSQVILISEWKSQNTKQDIESEWGRRHLNAIPS